MCAFIRSLQGLRQQKGFGDIAFDEARGHAVADALDASAGKARVTLQFEEQILARTPTNHRHHPVNTLDPFIIAGHEDIFGPADGVVDVTVTVGAERELATPLPVKVDRPPVGAVVAGTAVPLIRRPMVPR